MFSKEIARQAEACRFCWMCRHICPVAGSTGNESWTPRAKGLLLSMVERGTEYDAELAEVMYHCTLCDACANDCVTGFRPSEFVRAARTEALVRGIAPACVNDMIDTLLEKGSLFEGEALKAEGASEGAEVLLYLGQTARSVAKTCGETAAALFVRAGVAYQILEKEPDSGAYLAELMGYTGEVQQAAAKAAEAIEKSGAKTVVVLNPADAQIMKEQYPGWGLLPSVEVRTYTSFLAELVEKGRLTPKGTAEGTASLQEPVKLVRGLDEEKPAKALMAASGLTEKEMFLHGKMSRCIGTVPFDRISPETVREMVRVRTEDAERMGSKAIVTVSPDDYYLMKKYAAGTEITDLFSLL